MAVIRYLNLLFCFKAPELVNFSYISVIIESKPTLFIAWELKNAWFAKITPLKGKWYNGKKALVLSIPACQHELIFTTANFWKKKIVKIKISPVQLDQTSIAQLIAGFRPLSKVQITTAPAPPIRPGATISRFGTVQRNCTIHPLGRFNIIIQPFIYH